MSFEIRKGVLKRWLPENGESIAIIPNNVRIIGYAAFKDCTVLESVVIPDSVNELWTECFSGCCMLSRVEIPESVSYIGESAFRGCTALSEIILPENIVHIGGYAFSETPWLKRIRDRLVIRNKILFFLQKQRYICNNSGWS